MGRNLNRCLSSSGSNPSVPLCGKSTSVLLPSGGLTKNSSSFSTPTATQDVTQSVNHQLAPLCQPSGALFTQQASVSERIEQRVRAALHVAGSSYASIGLAREGADAARNNLELVSDAYSQGLVSIIELIDAQNAALVADLGAATAVYDFLVDWVEVERAVGRFSLFMTADERSEFFVRLEAFVAASGDDAA